MPQLQTGRGVVFLEGAAAQAPPGTLIGPAVAPPAGSPGAPPQPGQQEQDDGENQDNDDGQPASHPGVKSLERDALKRWLRKGKTARPFVCKTLTAADVPELDGDPRVVFVKADNPKALAGSGPAGSGTRNS